LQFVLDCCVPQSFSPLRAKAKKIEQKGEVLRTFSFCFVVNGGVFFGRHVALIDFHYGFYLIVAIIALFFKMRGVFLNNSPMTWEGGYMDLPLLEVIIRCFQ
jgi:hypothetical protein